MCDRGTCLAELVLQDADVRLNSARDRAQQLHALLTVLHLRPHLHPTHALNLCPKSFCDSWEA